MTSEVTREEFMTHTPEAVLLCEPGAVILPVAIHASLSYIDCNVVKSNTPNSYPIRRDAQSRNRRATAMRTKSGLPFRIKKLCFKITRLISRRPHPPEVPSILLNDYFRFTLHTNLAGNNRTTVAASGQIRLG